MRPDVLNPLFVPVTRLPGIGPKLGQVLGRLLVGADGPEARVGDLLFHLPVGVVDRSRQPGVAAAAQGSIVTLKVRVDRHAKSPRNSPRIPYRVYASDETGEVALTFFHARADWLEKTLPVGATVYVSGKMDWFNGRPSMVHPDHIVAEGDFSDLPLIEPVYPMTEGLSPKILVRAVGAALERLPDLDEWLDPALLGTTPLAGIQRGLVSRASTRWARRP
jgi:ATP-dependent DNA helicase RecG